MCDARSNGEEWYRLRSPVTRLMMDLQSISEFLPLINPVADDLVQRVFKIRDPDTGVIESLQNEIYKWSLECEFVLTSLLVHRHLYSSSASRQSIHTYMYIHLFDNKGPTGL